MKKLVFSCLKIGLFFLLPAMLKGQEYQPMAVEGAHWVVGVDFLQTLWLDRKYSFTVRGDTTVNGKDYKKVYQEGFEFNDETKQFSNKIVGARLYGLMRDDTTQRKVYAITGTTFFNKCPKNEEYLLFDFSVEEGDTLDWCSIDSLRFDFSSPQADSIRFVSPYFSDEPRKTIYTVFAVALHMDGTPVEITIPIIEGFGYEIIGPFIEGNFLIDYCIGTNADCGFTTSTKGVQRPNLKVFPNPTTEVLIIEEQSKHQINADDSFLQIIDLTGKIVKQRKLQNAQNTIDVKDLPKGLYVLKLVKKNAVFYQSRFVKN